MSSAPAPPLAPTAIPPTARPPAAIPPDDRPADRPADRLAAALLAGPALLTLVLVLHHPVLRGAHGAAGVAAGVAAISPALRLMHGGVLVLLAVQVLGFFRFSARMGWDRAAVAAGFLAYAAGTAVTAVPALLDGFVAPDLAAACLRAAQGCGPADGAVFRLVAVVIQDFTKAGLMAMSAGTGAWALAVLAGAAGRGAARAVDRVAGVVGLVCAVTPVVGLLGADVWLGPGNLAGFLAPQTVWAVLAAAVVGRGGSGAPSTAAGG
ncbi:hypothetical protein tb265_15080 [Gemmatimonadetes bacterium T265]|nr:hypothetical protein tb265_15080 [Gemmatimonadetes bacterium T265]